MSQYIRADYEPALCVEGWGWEYHHTGIPTDKVMPDEKYIQHLKFYASGFEKSPFGVEYIRFESDSPIHELVQKLPHVAFKVQDLDFGLANRGFNV